MLGLEIFSYSLKSAKRQIVFYTDSLVTKVLSGKRLPPNSKNYAEIRKYFMKLVSERNSGVELNEVADQVAKDRP